MGATSAETVASDAFHVTVPLEIPEDHEETRRDVGCNDTGRRWFRCPDLFSPLAVGDTHACVRSA
jgi:hypothetical protein